MVKMEIEKAVDSGETFLNSFEPVSVYPNEAEDDTGYSDESSPTSGIPAPIYVGDIFSFRTGNWLRHLRQIQDSLKAYGNSLSDSSKAYYLWSSLDPLAQSCVSNYDSPDLLPFHVMIYLLTEASGCHEISWTGEFEKLYQDTSESLLDYLLRAQETLQDYLIYQNTLPHLSPEDTFVSLKETHRACEIALEYRCAEKYATEVSKKVEEWEKTYERGYPPAPPGLSDTCHDTRLGALMRLYYELDRKERALAAIPCPLPSCNSQDCLYRHERIIVESKPVPELNTNHVSLFEKRSAEDGEQWCEFCSRDTHFTKDCRILKRRRLQAEKSNQFS